MPRKIVLPLVCLLISATVAVGQRISPLFQIVSANSLINRPVKFRKMQEEIADKYKHVPPGVRAEFLRTEMYGVRSALLEKLRSLEATIDNSSGQILPALKANAKDEESKPDTKVADKVPDGNAKIDAKVVDITPDGSSKPDTKVVDKASDESTKPDPTKEDKSPIDALEGYRLSVKTMITVFIDSAMKKIDNADIKQGVAFAVLEAMHAQGIVPERGPVSRSSSSDALAEELSWILADRLKADLYASFANPDLLLSPWSNIDATMRDIITKRIQTASHVVSSEISSSLVNVFDKAEHALVDLTEVIPFFKPSGTSGLAVTRGGGDVNGGIHLSMTAGSLWGIELQGGLYLNAQLDPPDTGQPGPLMAGGQFRVTWGDWQLDVLASYSPSDSSEFVQRTESIEWGAGLSCKVDGAVIGLGAFALKGDIVTATRNPDSTTTFQITSLARLTTGIQFRLPADQAPTFTLGWTWDPKDKAKNGTPVFQLGVPLTSKP